MEFRTFEAKKDDDGRRLDRVIRKFIPEKNLSGLYKALRKGLVRLNGKKAEPSSKVRPGDEVRIADFLLESKNSRNTEKTENGTGRKIGKTQHSYESENKSGRTQKQHPGLKIVFRNQDLVFIDKPYGVTVHGKENSLDNAVKDFYRKNAASSSLSFSPGPLHRLDGRTTGLVAFSWSLAGARWFSESMKSHSVKKEYIAVVQGKLESAQVWKDFIDSKNRSEPELKPESENGPGNTLEKTPDKESNKIPEKNSMNSPENGSGNKNAENEIQEKRVRGKDVRNDTKDGSETQSFRKVRISSSKENEDFKETLTEACPLSYGKTDGTEFTLVKFSIKTGRTHQIRAQSAFHGFPLLGDSAYGGKKIRAEISPEREFFLHAFRLSFPENTFSLPEIIECPPGSDFLEFLRASNCGTENISL